jgi:hypothetical protein
MNRLVTLSMEWKTSEFRQVMIALASGPFIISANDDSFLAGHTESKEVASNKQFCRAWKDPDP